MKNPINETIKEVLRYAVCVGISASISYIIEQFAVIPQTETVIILTFILKIADKFFHLYRKNNIVSTDRKSFGIIPF